MKIDFIKIALVILVIAVIVLGYGVFKTKKYEDSPDAISNKIAIEQLNKDKAELGKQVFELQKQQGDYLVLLKYKEAQIQSKEAEIKNLQKKLYEKIKYVSSLNDSSSFQLFSGWLTSN